MFRILNVNFQVNYVAKRRGVIITGCPPPTSQPWTHDYIRLQSLYEGAGGGFKEEH